MQFTYHPYGKPYVKKDKELQTSFKSIFNDLELYGRAFTTDSRAPKKLSFAMKRARDEGYIRFAREQRRHESRSMIVLKPGVKLKQIKKKTIRIYYAPK